MAKKKKLYQKLRGYFKLQSQSKKILILLITFFIAFIPYIIPQEHIVLAGGIALIFQIVLVCVPSEEEKLYRETVIEPGLKEIKRGTKLTEKKRVVKHTKEMKKLQEKGKKAEKDYQSGRIEKFKVYHDLKLYREWDELKIKDFKKRMEKRREEYLKRKRGS